MARLRNGSVSSGIEVDGPSQVVDLQITVAQHDRHRRPVGIKESEFDLLPEHAANGAVNDLLLNETAGDCLDERCAKSLDRGELYIHTGGQGCHGCFCPRAGNAMKYPQERDAEVVGHHSALEAPGVAQDAGQQPFVGRGRYPVDLCVGMHDRAHTAFADGHLERGQEHVRELTRPHRDGGKVAPSLRRGVADEVLEGRDDSGGLQTLDIRGRDGADQIGVFADGFFHSAPACVAHDVQHGSQALVHADRSHVGSDLAGHALHELGVEGRTPRQRHRVCRRPPRREPGEAFFVGDCGDTEAACGHDLLLRAHQRQGPEGRIDRRASKGTGELTESARQQLVEVDVVIQIVLVWRDFAPVGRRPHPHAVQLCGLLLQGHRTYESIDPL